MKKAVTLPTALFVAGALVFGLAHAQTRPVAEIRKANVTPEQAESIKKILADAKPETYSFSYAREGKEVTRAGSASFRDISMVKAYTKTGAGDAKSINEGLTTVSNYLKTIVTSKFSQMYPDKVRQINAVLEKSAAQ